MKTVCKKASKWQSQSLNHCARKVCWKSANRDQPKNLIRCNIHMRSSPLNRQKTKLLLETRTPMKNQWLKVTTHKSSWSKAWRVKKCLNQELPARQNWMPRSKTLRTLLLTQKTSRKNPWLRVPHLTKTRLQARNSDSKWTLLRKNQLTIVPRTSPKTTKHKACCRVASRAKASIKLSRLWVLFQARTCQLRTQSDPLIGSSTSSKAPWTKRMKHSYLNLQRRDRTLTSRRKRLKSRKKLLKKKTHPQT